METTISHFFLEVGREVETMCKVLGVTLNLQNVRKNISCTGNLLNIGLRKEGCLAGMLDADLYGIARKALILKNFKFGMEKWRLQFHLDPFVRIKRSQKGEQIIRGFTEPYDSILQIGSEFEIASRITDLNKPVFSYHDSNLHAYLMGAWSLPKTNKKIIKQTLEYEEFVYSRLTGIFTMTDYLRNIFIKKFHVPPHKVFNVGVGYNFDDVVELHNKDYDGKTILFIARHLFEQKGGLVVLEAFSKVKKEIPNAKLLLVGQKLNIDRPGVEVIGFLDKSTSDGLEKLRSLFLKASLFVMPSYYDALGNVFLEAMAHKVPCLGADCCAMPEIIVENKAGYVVKSGDSDSLASKMVELLKDKHALKVLGENGYKAIQDKYTWEIVTKKVISLIGGNF